jgi:hypothetical protein
MKADGSATGVALKSALLEKDLLIGNVALEAGTSAPAAPARRGAARNLPPKAAEAAARLNIRPFPVSVGGPNLAMVNGWISRDGYGFNLVGDAEMSRLIQVARTLGIGVPKFGIFGPAHVQVELAGEWRGFTQPTATGIAVLKNVRAEVPGIAAPVEISSATATLAANDIRLQNLTGSIDKMVAGGSAVFPRHCENDLPCLSHFELQFDELNADVINRLINPRLKSRPWYRMFGGDTEQSLLTTGQASGRVSAKRLVLGSMVANRLSGDFQVDKGRLQLSNVRADLFGGTHVGQWSADFTGRQPVYTGTGSLARAALAQIAALTHDAWGTGTLAGNYELSLTGTTAAELLQSAEGKATLQVSDVTLRHIALDAHALPLRASAFHAQLTLSKGVLRIDQSRIQTTNGIYDVSGTAKLNRTLELTLQRDGAPAYTVTGPLDKPQVTAAPTRQAEVSVKP